MVEKSKIWLNKVLVRNFVWLVLGTKLVQSQEDEHEIIIRLYCTVSRNFVTYLPMSLILCSCT